MKTRIDRGIYRETMRRLRLPALTMLVLATVFDALSQMLSAVFVSSYSTLYTFHPSLYAVPFIVPYLLTLIAFHFQTKRCDSDYYHALPFTRTTLSASILAAVASWCAIIIGVSSVILAVTPIALGELTVENTLIVTAATIVASLFMMALTFVATQLCGTTASMVFTTPILLFAPLILKNTLFSTIYNNVDLLPQLDDAALAPSRYNLLYGGYRNDSAWIWTVLLTVVLLAVGLYIAKRRPSETAGSAAIHPAAQAIIRLLLAFVCCLPAIVNMVSDARVDGILIVFDYVFAVVVYFLYELITTRSAKQLLRAVPWLGVLAILNVICVVICIMVPVAVISFSPISDDVDSISLTANVTVTDLSEEAALKTEKGDWIHSQKEFDGQSLFKHYGYGMGIYGYIEPGFYEWAELYDNSRCVRARVEDDDCIAMICAAYAVCRQDAENSECPYPGYTVEKNAVGNERATYEVVIDFHTGLLTRSRVVHLTETEYVQLLNAVNDVRPLPDYAFNFDAIV